MNDKKKEMATLRSVQYFVGEKQHRTSAALSLTQNTDVRAAQGLIRGSLVSACLHIGVFSACVVIQNAYRDCGQNWKGLPGCLEVNAFNKVWRRSAARNGQSLNSFQIRDEADQRPLSESSLAFIVTLSTWEVGLLVEHPAKVIC